MTPTMKLNNNDRGKVILPVDYVPTEFDVVCAKGRTAFNHPGNQRFRQIIDKNLERYKRADSKLKKSAIVDEIVELVRNESGIGGFVRRDHHNEAWYEIGDYHAREKVGHGFREALIKRNPEKQEERRQMRARNKAKKQQEKLGLDDEEVPKERSAMLSIRQHGARRSPRNRMVSGKRTSLIDEENDDEQVVPQTQDDGLTPLPLHAAPAIPDQLLLLLRSNIQSNIETRANQAMEEDAAIMPPPPPRLVSHSSTDLDVLVDIDSSELEEAIDLHDSQFSSPDFVWSSEALHKLATCVG